MPKPEKSLRNQNIVKMRNEGNSYRKIAEYFGLNVKTVFDIYKRFKDKI